MRFYDCEEKPHLHHHHFYYYFYYHHYFSNPLATRAPRGSHQN